jgi:flagellar motor switch protein FliN
VIKSEYKVDNADNGDERKGIAGEKPPAAKAIERLDPEIFGDVKVEVMATLGRGEMTVSDLVNLASDTVVPLDTPLNGLVDLKFKDRIVARGEIVSVGDQLGVRITEVVARK